MFNLIWLDYMVLKQATVLSTMYALFVYRLGHVPFTDGRGVRFSYSVPRSFAGLV